MSLPFRLTTAHGMSISDFQISSNSTLPCVECFPRLLQGQIFNEGPIIPRPFPSKIRAQKRLHLSAGRARLLGPSPGKDALLEQRQARAHERVGLPIPLSMSRRCRKLALPARRTCQQMCIASSSTFQSVISATLPADAAPAAHPSSSSGGCSWSGTSTGETRRFAREAARARARAASRSRRSRRPP